MGGGYPLPTSQVFSNPSLKVDKKGHAGISYKKDMFVFWLEWPKINMKAMILFMICSIYLHVTFTPK